MLGERIRARRVEKGLTQQQLADRIGKGVGSVSRYERDEFEPRSAVLRRLAEALGCSVDFLITGTKERRVRVQP